MQPAWKLLRPSSLAEITMGKSGKKERRKEGGEEGDTTTGARSLIE